MNLPRISLIFSALGFLSVFLLLGNQITSIVSGYFLIRGIYVFLDKQIPRLYLYVAVFNVILSILGIIFGLPPFVLNLTIYLYLGIIHIITGIVFIRKKNLGEYYSLVGYAFVLWGLHKLDYPFLRAIPWLASWGFVLGTILSFLVAIGMLLIWFEKIRSELSESETKYRSMMDAFADFVIICSNDCLIQYANPAIIRKLGY